MEIQHQQNEKHQQMKINEDTQHQKWTTTQKPPRGSPKQVPSLGVFGFWFQKIISKFSKLIILIIILWLLIIICNYKMIIYNYLWLFYDYWSLFVIMKMIIYDYLWL